MNAVDTNVLIYALDSDTPVKQVRAIDLLDRLTQTAGSTILPWQVVGEFLSNLRRRESMKRISSAEVESHFRRFITMFPLVIPNSHVFGTYFDLHTRFSLSHWDAMLLAACKEAGVTTLYSEDMDAGTNYDGLVITNPFV